MVFFRFGGAIANPFDDALVCDFLGGPDVPALDLFLNNSTGETRTGLHYDLVTLAESIAESSAVEPTGIEAALPTARKAKKKKLRRTNGFNSHDEVPSFFESDV